MTDIERLEKLMVDARSPNHSVHVHLSMKDNPKVTVDRQHLHRITEDSLAQQVGIAVSGGLQALRATGREIIDDSAPTTSPACQAEAPRTHQRVDDTLDESNVIATSPRDLVRVKLTGASDFTVKIRPHSLADHGVAAVVQDIDDALAQALESQGRQLADSYRSLQTAC